MAFRDLVTGAAGCGDAGSSSNPIAKLANSLLGTFQKDQEYRERPSVPTQQEVGQAAVEQGRYGPALSLPGSESLAPQPKFQIDHRSEFGRHYDVEDMVSQFQRIDWKAEGLEPGPGPQQHPALVGYLRNFFDSSRAQVPFRWDGLPDVDLSAFDKQRIRDRSSIIARHFMSDKGDEFIDAQVSTLLLSLNIEDGTAGRPAFAPRFSEMEAYWNASQPWKPAGQADQWAQEFNQEHPAANGWVQEFRDHHEADWAAQFAQERAWARPSMSELEGLDKSRSLVETLSGNQDPKFQNSRFLHFVSKMSRGELIIEDNQVKENLTASWANEYSAQTQPDQWAAEFTAGEHAHRSWADEFAQNSRYTADAWAEEYSATAPQSWADEYQQENNWKDSYEKFLEEELSTAPLSSSTFPYTFADENPYVGHANPLKEGQELFRKGLLSEAVLALEAEVLKHPDNAEGWRLLGVTHAENDDDRQAIASMVRARDADPTNLEVLLALGVSHTNELQQGEALRYLRGWLQHHPAYGKLVSSVANMDQLTHFQVAGLYHEAAAMAPEDGDVHTVLGVLYNLSREYDKAIQAFETALKLKPRDYSLWNKLGATQANSTRSADAIHAYQQALNLKPNYVRAWSNMGIGYANQSRYMESIPYYVRALAMNPKAENAWQYLRISLSAARPDLLDACERHDLDALQAQFPM